MSLDKFASELRATAAAIVAPGHGILAADESPGTISKRFSGISVENTEENRRAYRELLFTTPGLSDYISGVICFEETLGHSTADGTLFPQLLKDAGMIPGIKIDKGMVPINAAGEVATQGLDGLGARCAKYYEQGARFTKWRSTLRVPASREAILENAHGLARMAKISQQNGLVPIVEPEVLCMDGSHDIAETARVCEMVIVEVYKACSDFGVLLEGSLLKPNMVLPGNECPQKASPAEVAHFTVTVFGRSVPAAVAGVVFLSGGQSEEEATLNLDAINRHPGRRPWQLSFSYGRALQHSVLRAWKGDAANVGAAQDTLLVRAKANSQAQLGTYEGGSGGDADESLYVKDYVY